MPDEKKKPGIKVTKNGPYIVSGGAPLSDQVVVNDAEGIPEKWRGGKEYPLKETCALCRCGHSGNKPYCDGTHLSVDFNGTEVANNVPYVEKAKNTEGPELALSDCGELCVGASFCDRAGTIWKLIPASDDPQAKKTAIEEGQNCPSGRLVVRDKAGKALEPDYEPCLGLMQNPGGGIGPILVRGGITIESADGTVYEKRNRVTLCRCGKSKNKPFCDGSHRG